MQDEPLSWGSEHIAKWVMGWFQFNGTWVDLATREQVLWKQRPLSTREFNVYTLEFFVLILERLKELGITAVIESRFKDKGHEDPPPPYVVRLYEGRSTDTPAAEAWGNNLMIVFINLIVDYSKKRRSEHRPLI